MPPHQATVLNINGDKAALYFSSRVLRDAGFHVLEAATVKEALPLARQRPDLIVVDTRLEASVRCDICRESLAGLNDLGVPVLHLVAGPEDMVNEADCPLRLPSANLHWPASASVLLATVCELLRPGGTLPPAAGDPDLLGRLALAASYQVDPLGNVLEWGAAAEHLYGWTSAEVIGRFLPVVDAAHRDEFLDMLDSVRHGQPLYRWETLRQTRSGKQLSVALSMMPILGDDGKVDRIQIVAADTTETRRLQGELRLLSEVILASNDLVCTFDTAGQVDFINPAGRRLLNTGPPGNSPLKLADLLPPAASDRLLRAALPRVGDSGTWLEQITVCDATGAEVPLSVQLVRLGAGNSGRYALIGRDIGEQASVLARLQRLNRILVLLEKCNEAIQQPGDENALFEAVCRLAVDVGGHGFALVSLIDPGPGQRLQPVAWAGDELVTASELAVSWNPDEPRGQGPTGAAVRTGQVVVRHGIGQQPEYSPWAAFFGRLGLRSMVALPLNHGVVSMGVLGIYSTRDEVFDADEVNLLQDLARQLAHGIHALRAEAGRRQAEATLRLYAGAIEATQTGIMVSDARRPDHPVVYVNPAFTRITGWAADDIAGQNGRVLVAGDLQQPGLEAIRRALRERQPGQATVRSFRKDGTLFWNDLHVAPIRNAEQEVTHTVSVITDVSERIGRENQLAHLATHDPLTGLANRTLFNDRLQQAILRAERNARQVGILLIDLDHFKTINDTLGHGTGDVLLHMVANRFKGLTLESDTLARLGGDEFVLVLADLDNPLDVPRTAALLIELMETPFDIHGEPLHVSLSVGSALYPNDATDAESLLRQADMAMYEVKESGRNGYRGYTADLVQRVQHQRELEKDLRRALDQGELLLHYQPKADLYSGQLTGVEALIRWQHPEHGLVPPVQFIPLAESTGLIVPIGTWVLREACRQARAWQDAGLPPLRVSVNLSAVQFRQPDLLDIVGQALADCALDPACLELEVTESLVMENPETAADYLRRLKTMGIRLAMDDFGTGYSSLGYLRRFPFDVLKIDRSFVQNIVSEPNDALIAVAVIAMAHSLGLQVIAEGVEDESQMRYLRAHLCDEIQGYLFSPPLPAAELAAFARQPSRLQAANGQGERSERTLLLVDDEPDILNALKRLLRRSGYRILTAGSAAEGLELLALNPVQVVVSDQRMPTMSGSEFLGRVRAMYPDTMRIVLSGYTELSALTDAINRGAVYKFVTKPWEDEELRGVIRNAFVEYEERASQMAAAGREGGK